MDSKVKNRSMGASSVIFLQKIYLWHNNVTIISSVHHPNSSRHVFSSTPLPQCSSALFLNPATKLCLYSCCTFYGSAMHTTSSFFVLLNLFSCAFPFARHVGSFCWCSFCSLVTCAIMLYKCLGKISNNLPS